MSNPEVANILATDANALRISTTCRTEGLREERLMYAMCLDSSQQTAEVEEVEDRCPDALKYDRHAHRGYKECKKRYKLEAYL